LNTASFFHFAWHYLPALLEGTEYTLLIWVIGVTGGFFFGWLLAIGRAYGNRFVHPLATAYIELFRGTPMLAQMFIIYSGLPNIGIVLSPLWAAIWAIGLNTSAYQAEYFRGGIGAIRSGQMAAGRPSG
jgi:polar amino acid transport system permease protein